MEMAKEDALSYNACYFDDAWLYHRASGRIMV